MSQRIFCVGLNGKPGNLEAILKGFAPYVYEVCAAVPPSLMGSGRAGAMPLTLETMAQQVEIAHAAEVGYNALLNAVCLGGLQFQSDFKKQLLTFFQFARDVKVDALTIANPFVLHEAVEFRNSSGAKFALCLSSLADVTDAFSARRYEEMGVDRIILHQNVNRNFQALRQILESVSCKIELYVNTGSLYKCPYRQAHRAFISHLSTLAPEALSEPENRNWLKENCIAIRRRDPLEIVMAPTIRPEDLYRYEQVGAFLFKISARTMSTDWVLSVLNAYVARCFEGNIADICDTNLGRDMPMVANRLLDGMLDEVMAGCESYENICRRYYAMIFVSAKGMS